MSTAIANAAYCSTCYFVILSEVPEAKDLSFRHSRSLSPSRGPVPVRSLSPAGGACPALREVRGWFPKSPPLTLQPQSPHKSTLSISPHPQKLRKFNTNNKQSQMVRGDTTAVQKKYFPSFRTSLRGEISPPPSL
jgi:hypothetical protein